MLPVARTSVPRLLERLGIAETTWPGVYTRSRLPGRDDYFQLPDWNTYVEGGKALDLALPDEPFNRIEIRGAAFGQASYAAAGAAAQPLFRRAAGSPNAQRVAGIRDIVGGRSAAYEEELRKANVGTLLHDQLTEEEDRDTENRFDIQLLSGRLAHAVHFLAGPAGDASGLSVIAEGSFSITGNGRFRPANASKIQFVTNGEFTAGLATHYPPGLLTGDDAAA